MRSKERRSGRTKARWLAVGSLVGVASLSADGAALPSPPPKLVVILVVDQMRGDFFDRFSMLFGTGGFRRLVREGRSFSDARYAHASTTTGPGHAVVGSGVYGNVSGIVGNSWFSRGEQVPVYCADGPVAADDPRKCAGPGRPASLTRVGRPRNPCYLEATSLAQRVKRRWPRARVVAASIKDRAAILTVGSEADAAYWFEQGGRSREFTSSAFYSASEALLRDFNGSVLRGFRERVVPNYEWRYSLPVPPAEICPDDLPQAHVDRLGLGPRFPHKVESLTTLLFTPLGDEMLAEFVKMAVRAHGLGRNPAGDPDILAVSFSSADHVGHFFGPDSCEVADEMARLDRVLEGLLGFLEEWVGRKDLVVFLTSDHGVASVPEVARAKGLSAGRVYLGDEGAATIGDLPPERQRLERELQGSSISASTPIRQAIVRSVQEPNVYLNREKLADESLPLWRSRLRRRLLTVVGVKEVYTADEIQAGKAPEAVRMAFRSDRSGDLVVVLAPNWIFDSQKDPMATDHGQPYDYDMWVPLVAWGGAVHPGVVHEQVDVARIAPTIARVLDLDRSGFSRPDPLPLGAAKERSRAKHR